MIMPKRARYAILRCVRNETLRISKSAGMRSRYEIVSYLNFYKTQI